MLSSLCGSPSGVAADATSAHPRQPVVFVSHGPGPLPLLGRCPDMWKEWTQNLGPIVQNARPRAICVVSAHWEVPRGPAVLAPVKPSLLYDYYGFPKAAYDLNYPCPGIPKELLLRVTARLQQQFPKDLVTVDQKRGLDHGSFVPLLGILPKANIPVFQVALQQGGDFDWHVRLGKALAPLRDEGILILASGMTYHQFRNPGPEAIKFNNFLKGALRAMGKSSADGALIREREITRLKTDAAVMKMARDCHPTHEHLTPLVVAAAAAGWGPAKLEYDTPGAMDFVWDAAWPYDKPRASGGARAAATPVARE